VIVLLRSKGLEVSLERKSSLSSFSSEDPSEEEELLSPLKCEEESALLLRHPSVGFNVFRDSGLGSPPTEDRGSSSATDDGGGVEDVKTGTGEDVCDLLV
jgi:hypothetical protein